MPERRHNFDELERARQLAPRIRAAEDQIEAHRELPAELARELAAQGMFRLLLPASFGGAALALPEYVRVIEVIGEADGSTGWCVTQGAVFANISSALNPETANEIWGVNPDAVVATGIPFGSQAQEIEDGHRLSGRWRFSSGCMHANWLSAMSPVVTADGERMPPRAFLFPRSQANIGNGWNVRGMRGTGSREYTLDGLEIPLAHSFPSADLSQFRGDSTGLTTQLLFASGFGTLNISSRRHAYSAQFSRV